MTVSVFNDVAESEVEPPEVKSGVLENFIAQWAAPVAGLHAILATVMVLSNLYPTVAWSIALPVGLLGAIASIAFVRIGSGLAAPSILLIGLAVTLVYPSLHMVIAPAVAAVVALLMARGKIGKYAFWWIALYLPIIEQVRYWSVDVADGRLSSLILCCAIFALASLIFYLRDLQAANIASIFGFCLTILLAIEAFLDLGAVAAALGFAFTLAVIWYGWKQRAEARSDFAILAIDGLVQFLLLMAVLAIFRGADHSGDAVLRTWGFLALVYVAVRIWWEPVSAPPRLCWASIVVVALVLTIPDIETDTVLCVTVVAAFGLQAAAVWLRNQFIAIFSSLLALVVLATILLENWDKVSPGAFAISIAAVAVTVIAQWELPDRRLPWWRGLMMKRHAVRVRASVAKSGTVLASLPFAGAAMTLSKSLWSWVDYAGTGGSTSRFQQFVTAVNLALFVLFAVREVDILAYLSGWDAVARTLVGHGVWMFCGVVCYGLGRLLDLRIQRFVGYLFVIVPLFIEGHHYIKAHALPANPAGYYSWIALLAGASMATIGILRSIRPSVKTAGQ
jgi:hypothetical protein